MGIGDVLKPAGDMFGSALTGFAKYAWVLWIFLGVGVFAAIFFFWHMHKQKKAQWTHTFKVQRVMKGGLLSDAIIHKARRFPIIKNAQVFELEKPIIGSYLIPEPGKYSGLNEYSIILDGDNRIWVNEGEYFNPTAGSVSVSARHAEIDLQTSTLTADWQNINKVNKRIDWAQIAKYVLSAIMILAVMIVAIVGIGEWGEAQERRAESDKAFAQLGSDMKDAMTIMLEAKNTDILIIDRLNNLYGTSNIPGVIRNVKNQTA